MTLTINELTSEMAGKKNKLTVTNDEGTTEYVFVLEVGEKPMAGEDEYSLVSSKGMRRCQLHPRLPMSC